MGSKRQPRSFKKNQDKSLGGGFHLVECSEAPCNVPAFQSSPVFFQGWNEGRHRSNGGVHRSKKETESGQAGNEKRMGGTAKQETPSGDRPNRKG
ncbi:hypothetical protein TNCV_4585791 [Trichonephila clavipes]|nr:hypothetical protein TNCV_4585791 [Trichonephila clavipes]